ncbi:EF-hand domain-containing protein 1-like isoform X2 [Rhodnius prolixus]
MVYGKTKTYLPPVFKPHFVLYDKKCLSFKGYMTELINNETRVRFVIVTYFLEDDSLTVLEPPTINAGFPQGKLVTRGRYPRDNSGQLFHWKDLNVGMDLTLNAKTFHLYSCDKFTREYLTSQGMEINGNEECPTDAYTEQRKGLTKPKSHITADSPGKIKSLLEGKVLRFQAIWDDDSLEYAEKTLYTISYFLENNTIEIKEIRPPNSGKEGPTKIMARRKVPKCVREIQDTLPVYLEMTEEDVNKYLEPLDFLVGKTINIFYRRFLLIDCDEFTRKYCDQFFKISQPDPIKIEKKKLTRPSQPLPPYLGFGTPEDSIQSWLSIIPKKPKKDEMRMFINMSKKLRYTAELDWVHPEDKGRQFVIEYRLSDGYIKITELRMENSGHTGGGFLKFVLVPKEGCDPNMPEYVTPRDFVLGEVISIFGHRFIITGMDVAVYRFMEANPEKFSEEAISDARRHLVREGLLTEDVKDLAEYRKREDISEPVIVDDGTRIDKYRALDLPHKADPTNIPECRSTYQEQTDN